MTDLCLKSKASLGYDEAFMAMCVEELTITPQRLKRDEFWVYENGGKVLGFVCLKPDGDGISGEIKSFFIEAGHKGMGIGRVLWSKALERAQELDLERLHLDSEPLSVGFYEKLGFKVTGETPSGSIPDRMLPKMELEIRAPAQMQVETDPNL